MGRPLTLGELIEELSKFPGDLEVRFSVFSKPSGLLSGREDGSRLTLKCGRYRDPCLNSFLLDILRGVVDQRFPRCTVNLTTPVWAFNQAVNDSDPIFGVRLEKDRIILIKGGDRAILKTAIVNL